MAESIIDSTPIFHGGLAGYRSNVIRGERIREDCNADDSQFAIIVRRKGYRSIHDPKAFFYEYVPADSDSNQVQKVRRGQGISRIFWYNRDILFNKKFNKYGSIIFPFNFFIHIISPILLYTNFFYLFIYSLNIIVYYYEKSFLLLILLIIGIMIRFSRFIDNYFLKTIWTFIDYQFILLEGMFLFIIGKPLYKWKMIESIRNKFQLN
jgi:cellulose synthase/poly-beta-1,6-N-acetylglucosamine synthase-like glycosyltransferase